MRGSIDRASAGLYARGSLSLREGGSGEHEGMMPPAVLLGGRETHKARHLPAGIPGLLSNLELM